MILETSIFNRRTLTVIILLTFAGTTLFHLGVFERLSVAVRGTTLYESGESQRPSVVARGTTRFQSDVSERPSVVAKGYPKGIERHSDDSRFINTTQQYLEYQATLRNDKRDDVANCSFPLGTTAEEDLAKIESYQFSHIQQYIEELFPTVLGEPEAPTIPVLVSAASSNHFLEIIALFENLNDTVFRKYKNLKLIVYDIGLDSGRAREIIAVCSCELRKFPFEKYPRHVTHLKHKAWKPIIIQLVAKEHPLLIWMDTSERFLIGELDEFFNEVKSKWLIVQGTIRLAVPKYTIAALTHSSTFKILHEHPCTFGNQAERFAGFVAVFANTFINKYFLRPLVACALSVGCMTPIGNIGTVVVPNKLNRSDIYYHKFHRYEQSMIGILFTRLFHRNQEEHIIKDNITAIARLSRPVRWKKTL